MKKGILYILLFSYSTLMLKPVLPYISDAVAHVFWYSQHMATVHYVNGKFHVHKEVMESEKKNTADRNPFSTKKEQSQNDHLVTIINTTVTDKHIINEYPPIASDSILPGYLKAGYPPPKFC